MNSLYVTVFVFVIERSIHNIAFSSEKREKREMHK